MADAGAVSEETKRRAAAAKSYIENMYRNQSQSIQERYARCALGLCVLRAARRGATAAAAFAAAAHASKHTQAHTKKQNKQAQRARARACGRERAAGAAAPHPLRAGEARVGLYAPAGSLCFVLCVLCVCVRSIERALCGAVLCGGCVGRAITTHAALRTTRPSW